MSKNKCSITAIFLKIFGVFFIGAVIVAGILFFNEKTIVVPDDEPTIQDAVDAADPGDIILVKASGGPYNEAVTIDKEKIKLIGIGKEKPVLDGTGLGVVSGIAIDNTFGVLVKNFIVQNFGLNGIFLSGSGSNMLKGNNTNKNEGGIFLSGSDSNMLKGNNANNNKIGIVLTTDSDSNMLKGNNANNNEEVGIFLSGSDSNMLKGNNANNNEIGIVLTDSDSNMLKGNNTNKNEGGIFLSGSDSNMLKGNNANNNTDNGILLDDNSNFNDVFFNRAFGNGTFDIEDEDANNFKGNKCDTSDPAGICN